MWIQSVVLVLGISLTQALWSCTNNSECSILTGSVCSAGSCVCPPGTESALGGTVCFDSAPYYSSPCVDDFQCSRLSFGYQCEKSVNETRGTCACRSDFHYFRGRCWKTSGFGEACTSNEECLQHDAFSFTCNGTCVCSEGHYSRQAEECRKIANAVGENCILDADCQFENGVCNQFSLVCEDSTATDGEDDSEPSPSSSPAAVSATRRHGLDCSATACEAPFVCSTQGTCICPVGYFPSDDGTACLADLGSPSTPEQCVGLFKEVRDGVCTCQANLYYNSDLRSCVKASRTITDSCLSDLSCRTLGPASCGAPQLWGIRYCECDAERSVWDSQRVMCRFYAGVGETCQVNSDCLAGELEIQCVLNSEGQGICTCPEGLDAVDGLCLRSGLGIEEACQSNLECTGTPNLSCEQGVCSCENGYQAADGICAPAIGGTCTMNSDCIIEGTVCTDSDSVMSCQCDSSFVEYQDACWITADGHNASCTVDAQCSSSLGSASCVDGRCDCADGYHFQDGACWRETGLFEFCSRSSECYLSDGMDRVECRNGLCQCDYRYSYSEVLNTCVSSANNLMSSLLILTSSVVYLYLF